MSFIITFSSFASCSGINDSGTSRKRSRPIIRSGIAYIAIIFLHPATVVPSAPIAIGRETDTTMHPSVINTPPIADAFVTAIALPNALMM